MGTGNSLEPTSDELVQPKSRAQDETLHHEGATQENKVQETWPFAECKTWHDSSGTLGVVYVQGKRLLDWEALALLTQESKDGQQRGSPQKGVTLMMMMPFICSCRNKK
jgi:hypothetical protein